MTSFFSARSRRAGGRLGSLGSLGWLVTLLAAGTTALSGQEAGQPRADTELHLTVEEAIARGEQANLQALLASAAETEAEGLRRQALARLFPQIEVAVAESRQKINLASFGLPAPEGESSLIGPFDVFDARVSLQTPLFDARASAGAHAAKGRLEAARRSVAAARDEVAAAVADLYLAAVTARSRVATSAAQIETALAVATAARDRHDAGRVAGIDVLRAEVALAGAEQHGIESEHAVGRIDLLLERAIGTPPGTVLALDPLPFAALPLPDLAAALEEARVRRSDLAAAQATAEAFAAAESAARRQRIPRLDLRASFGPSGPSPATAEDTYDATALLRFPIVDAGRIAGEIEEAAGRATAARARLADLETGVEIDLRSALLDADAALRAVSVAEQGLELARRQLEQGRDRFAAGVASSLEVTQAQSDLAAADERSVGALEDYNRAKIALARALGVAGDSTASFLRGHR